MTIEELNETMKPRWAARMREFDEECAVYERAFRALLGGREPRPGLSAWDAWRSEQARSHLRWLARAP